jgi:hypothetical protein
MFLDAKLSDTGFIKEDIIKMLQYRNDFLYDKITLFKERIKWADAISSQGHKNDYVMSIKSEDKVNNYISRRLAHIIINPTRRKDDAVALINSYVYSKDDNAINHSEDSVDKFVKEICAKSKRNRNDLLSVGNSGDSYAINRDSTRLLIGDRGCGKTFFCNHILAKYSCYFDDKKIIWVRINLVDDFGDNSDLIHWMYAQATKIILRYYCADSVFYEYDENKKPIDVLGYLQKYINNDILEDSVREKRKEELQELVDVFVRNSSDEPISPKLVPISIARKVWECAYKDNGYSFIVVFDGMDRLEITSESYEKFKLLISNFHKLIKIDELFPAIILVTCRRKSADLLSRDKTQPYGQKPLSYLEIGGVDFEDVLYKRVEYLKDYILSGRSSFRECEGVAENIDKFVNYIKSDISAFKIFGYNMRASMQAAQLRYQEFVALGINNKHYRWIESFMKMGYMYPPKLYDYIHSDDKIMPFMASQREKSYDNRLLVSIYSYPYFEYEINHKILPSFNNVLIGTRLLQLINNSDRLYKEKRTLRSRITVEYACEVMQTCFNYTAKYTKAVIREYVEYELIETECKNLERHNMPNNTSFISLTKKGKYVLDDCLFDVAYLGLSAMRIPMRCDYLVGGEKSSVFIVQSYKNDYHGEHNVSNLVKWVSAKTINAINMYKLISVLYERQVNYVSANKVKILADLKKRAGGGGRSWKEIIMIDYLNSIMNGSMNYEQIKKQLFSMIDSVVEIARGSELSILIQAIEANKKIWGIV